MYGPFQFARVGFVGLIAVCLEAGPAASGSCDPAPAANPTGLVTCDDGGPAAARFAYGAGRQEIELIGGEFTQITAGDGDDQFTVSGGVTGALAGQAGDDTFIGLSGSVGVVSGGEGNDVLELRGADVRALSGLVGDDVVRVTSGTVGRISGGDGADDILLSGGSVGEVDAGGGNDSVTLDGTATVTGVLQGGDGAADRLTLTGAGAIDASLIDFETVLVDAGGDWTLDGSGLSGGLTVGPGGRLTAPAGADLAVVDFLLDDGAALLLEGRIVSAFGNLGAVISGAVSGSGVLEATSGAPILVTSTATISPGSSIGTLTFRGPVTRFESGARLISELDPGAAQNADLFVIEGDAQRAERLTVEASGIRGGLTPAELAAGGDYTLLRATGLSGAPTVTEGANLPAAAQLQVVGDPAQSGEVTIRFIDATASPQLPTVIANKPQVTATGNPNHSTLVTTVAMTAVTNPTVTLATGQPVIDVIPTLTNGNLAAFNGVHAEAYATHLSVLLEQLDEVANTVMDHASGLGQPFGSGAAPVPVASQGGAAGDARSRVWFDAGFVTGDIDGDNGLGGVDYQLYNIVVGVDLFRSEAFTGGAFLGAGRSETGEHDVVDQDFETDAVHAGLYARYLLESGVTLSGVAGLSYARTETERDNPAVGGFTGGTAEAEFDSIGLFAGLRAAKTFGAEGFLITPSAGAYFGYVDQESAQETGGGDFNYRIGGSSAESLVTSLGLSLERPIATGAGVLTPVAFGRYEHDWLAGSDDEHDVTVTSPVFGAFRQVGQSRGDHGFVVGAGLSYALRDEIGLSAGYLYSHRSNGEEHGFGANLTIRF